MLIDFSGKFQILMPAVPFAVCLYVRDGFLHGSVVGQIELRAYFSVRSVV